MEYRIATERDLIQLAELRWNFRNEGRDEIPVVNKDEFINVCCSFYGKRLESGYWAYWIAVESNEIVSQIMLCKVDMVPRPCKIVDQFGYITNIYTKPEYRNKGIASQLIKIVIQWAKEQDLELLILWPSEDSISFYERAGFDSNNEIMQLTLRDY